MKYNSVVNFSKRFTGSIENFGDKVIGDLTQIADDSHIHGSQKWKEKKLLNMKARINQTGNSFFKVKLKIEQMDEESQATALIISGKTITFNFEGGDGMLLDRQYFIHPSHGCESPCAENCQVVPLNQYLEENAQENSFFSDKWISVFNSTAYIKMNSLKTNIFGCVNITMFSEEMTFSLHFDQKGNAVIVGALWTKASEKFNKELSDSSYTGRVNKDIRSEFLSHIESSLTSTTKLQELEDFLSSPFNWLLNKQHTGSFHLTPNHHLSTNQFR